MEEERPDTCDQCKVPVNQLFYLENKFLCSKCFHATFSHFNPKDVIVFDCRIYTDNGKRKTRWMVNKYIPEHFKKGVTYG